jgi:acetyl esterase/lipase
MIWLVTLATVLLAVWAFARFYLGGRDLSAFDFPVYDAVRDAPSPEHTAVLHLLRNMGSSVQGLRGQERLNRLRELFEHMSDDADLSGVSITSANADGVPGEWVTPAGNDVKGRLLYIHGGAFVLGSARGYRRVTTRLARRTGLAVFAIDYRLLPENRRREGIEDCQTAYRWMLDNGPQGPSRANAVFVAGDSAGGNLTLMLIAWARDAGLRPADGAIALSPATDSTFASPSLKHNVEDDPMLGPLAAMASRVPRSLLLLATWINGRIRPSDPIVSPIRGRLSDLPPVLVQASEAEILIDDARRYVNKARHEGSPAELETWHGMIHVWQAFAGNLPEADEAFCRIGAFVARCRPAPADIAVDSNAA